MKWIINPKNQDYWLPFRKKQRLLAFLLILFLCRMCLVSLHMQYVMYHIFFHLQACLIFIYEQSAYCLCEAYLVVSLSWMSYQWVAGIGKSHHSNGPKQKVHPRKIVLTFDLTALNFNDVSTIVCFFFFLTFNPKSEC